MTNCEIIIALGASLIGGLIGGFIAIFAALNAVNRSEFYHLRSQLKDALFIVDAKLSDEHSGHPVKFVIDNPAVDNLAIATIAVSPRRIRKDLQTTWDKYRYGENIENGIPTEYGTMPEPAKRLIKERLHNIVSLLN
jgi:hypothetical protein